MTSPTSIPGAIEMPALREQVLAALAGGGLPGQVDGDGDIAFEVNGQHLFARCTQEGIGLVRIFGQWQIIDDLPGETSDRLAAAHLVTASHVLAKVSVQNSTLLVAVDTLTPPGSRLDLIVPAAVQAVLSAVTMWHRAVVGDDPFVDPLDVEPTDG